MILQMQSRGYEGLTVSLTSCPGPQSPWCLCYLPFLPDKWGHFLPLLLAWCPPRWAKLLGSSQGLTCCHKLGSPCSWARPGRQEKPVLLGPHSLPFIHRSTSPLSSQGSGPHFQPPLQLTLMNSLAKGRHHGNAYWGAKNRNEWVQPTLHYSWAFCTQLSSF